MPYTEQQSFILLLIFAVHFALYSIGGGVLLAKYKEQHDRSRIFISIFYLCLAAGCSVFILTALLRDTPAAFMNTILEPYPSIVAFVYMLFLAGYVLEITRPHWLTWKRLLVLLSPWLAMSIGWIIYHGVNDWQYDAITHIEHWTQIPQYVQHPDVILRLILAGLYFPYFCSLCFIPHNWRQTNVTHAHLFTLKGLVFLSTIGVVLGMLLRINWVIIAYLVILDIMEVYILHIEFLNRIPVPKEETTTAIETPAVEKTHLSPLAQQVKRMMEQGLWQNPDLQRSDMCQLLGTNYTYLSHAVQELGYTNFGDMINHYRTLFIREELLLTSTPSMSDIFFRAGYRNRTTAVRCFIQHYGCPPSEYKRGGEAK